MLKIKQIEDRTIKSQVTERILRDLPSWFGIESSTLSYIKGVKDKPMYVASIDDEAIGFLSVEHHNTHSAEIYVMGVLKDYHRQGIGKALVEYVKSDLKEKGYQFFLVKTLSDRHPDEGYKKTRLFYKRVGFLPLEELLTLWDDANPCLNMIQVLQN